MLDFLIDNLLSAVAAVTFWFNSGSVMMSGSSVIDCASCPCGYTEGGACQSGGADVCDQGNSPAQCSVTLPSLTNAACSDCADFGQEWVMDQGTSPPDSNYCNYEASTGVCNSTTLSFILSGSGSSLTILQASPSFTHAVYSVSESSPYDCASFTLSKTSSFDDYCSGWGSSLTVDAV